MICLIKEKSNDYSQHTKFYAPQGKTDDVMCSMAMMNYAATWTRMCEMERKQITLGKYIFIPRLRKISYEEQSKQKVTNWLFR